MECLFLLLRKTELIDELIERLKEADVHHGTIIDAKSMSTALSKWNDVPMFGLFRNANNHEYNEDVKMMMFLLEEEHIQNVKRIIKDVIGDMSKPKTAVMFTLPVSSVEGIVD